MNSRTKKKLVKLVRNRSEIYPESQCHLFDIFSVTIWSIDFSDLSHVDRSHPSITWRRPCWTSTRTERPSSSTGAKGTSEIRALSSCLRKQPPVPISRWKTQRLREKRNRETGELQREKPGGRKNGDEEERTWEMGGGVWSEWCWKS